jgi:GNAT superfamily N-acetyltransferase
MNVKCFACEVVIEGADAEACADAFVAHGRESHAWNFPETALRNYARNFAEASVRLSGNTERRSEIGQITIHPVTADRIDDWLQFFDHDGFAGNPDWASCYCLEPHEPATSENPERAWRDTRATMIARLRSGATFGYLAYVDGKAAGWVNASTRDHCGLYRLVDPDGPDPKSVIGISCFVVAPPYRRHGIASALLDRVIADAPVRGVAWIEAYPHNQPQENDAGHFRGPRSMYDAREFAPVKERERDTLVRRPAQ